MWGALEATLWVSVAMSLTALMAAHEVPFPRHWQAAYLIALVAVGWAVLWVLPSVRQRRQHRRQQLIGYYEEEVRRHLR